MESVIKRFGLVLKTLTGMTILCVFTAASVPSFVALTQSANIEAVLQSLVAIGLAWGVIRLTLYWMDRSNERKDVLSDLATFFRVPLQWDTIGPISLGLILAIRRYFL